LFNKATSLVKMEHYLDAGEAFDEAYQVYYQLVDDDATRPYRITWYQTTPYMAYYFSGRYQDVINLANFTFETISEPTLEESLYWRGLAYYALGNKALAKSDLYNAVWLNPNFEAGLIQISNLIFD
jgi:tetratricopeptide (TPR) repeat protein